MSFSAALTRRVAFVGEGYGYTLLNDETPAIAAVMAGVTYQLRPRLLLDAGLDLGVSPNAPNQRVFVGGTYAIGNLFARLRSSR